MVIINIKLLLKKIWFVVNKINQKQYLYYLGYGVIKIWFLINFIIIVNDRAIIRISELSRGWHWILFINRLRFSSILPIPIFLDIIDPPIHLCQYFPKSNSISFFVGTSLHFEFIFIVLFERFTIWWFIYFTFL